MSGYGVCILTGMSAPSKSAFLNEVTALLKARHFKKKRTTWHLDQGEVIAVFNVQTSQWDNDNYYINVGVYLKNLGRRLEPPECECHVRNRIDPEEKSASQIVVKAMRWFQERATTAEVKARAVADSRRAFVRFNEIEKLMI